MVVPAATEAALQPCLLPRLPAGKQHRIKADALSFPSICTRNAAESIRFRRRGIAPNQSRYAVCPVQFGHLVLECV
eukprot:3935626-Rhodomonas_salina.1